MYQPLSLVKERIKRREGSNAGGCGRSLQLGKSVGAYEQVVVGTTAGGVDEIRHHSHEIECLSQGKSSVVEA
jgi:hypothetical protein